MMRLLAILLFTLFYFPLMAQPASRYDVLITEIMVDPDPSVGLPNAEYIELKNKSSRPLNLQGWRLTTTSSTSGAFPAFVLQPDSFVILSSASQLAALSHYGRAIAVPALPALINNSTTLTLLSAENKTIHALMYTNDWYGNATKAAGGYSLEMIDDSNPCAGFNNWTASTAPQGGTPGKPNAVAATNKDETPPALLHAIVVNPTTLRIHFSETIDSSSAVAFANYRLQPAIEITGVKAVNPLLQQVELTLHAPLDSTGIYTLTVLQVADCSGNSLGTRNRLPVGRPQAIEAGDIVINEILFNPKPAGSDYIELYNRSHKVLDVSTLFIANRAANGQLANSKKILQNPFYVFPGDYMVVTENAAGLSKQYFVPNVDAVLPVSSLPSMPDDAGKVVLHNHQNLMIDEVHYTHDWHHALIADKEGVALERIDPNGPSLQKSNWHSAATSVGYGSPTYKNSQLGQPFTKASVTISPKTFSPDGDGYDDMVTIEYSMATGGFVANVIVYDAAGRKVKHLVKNNLLSQQGSWQWNGQDDNGRTLTTGTYIIYTEMFNTQGEKQHFKHTTVLAKKF